MISSLRSEGGKVLTRAMPMLLAMSPLPFSVSLAFLYAGVRARHRRWTWIGARYSAATVGAVWLSTMHPLGFVVWFGVWAGGTAHAYAIRNEVGERVYRLNGGAPVPAPAPARRAIEAAEHEMEGRRRCRYCGGLMGPDVRDCPGCGAPA